MKITFRIHYLTQWGQQISIVGNLPQLGAGRTESAFLLEYKREGVWEGALELPTGTPVKIKYRYYLSEDNGRKIKAEGGPERQVDLSVFTNEHLLLQDAWRIPHHADEALYTSAFTEGIFRPLQRSAPAEMPAGEVPSLRFCLRLSRVPKDCDLFLIGNLPQLGGWDPEKAVPLSSADYPYWKAWVVAPEGQQVKYKYFLRHRDTGETIYEWGEDRVLRAELFNRPLRHWLVQDEYFRHPKGQWKGSGVAIPVFSLRTHHSLGVGEFLDIRSLVDWAQATGLQVVQILPINDTTATNTAKDSYPYAAISAFALHPLYLNLDLLGTPKSNGELQQLAEEKKRLNAFSEVPYEHTMRFKMSYARRRYNEQKENLLKDESFLAFFEENKHWLVPYAAFSYLRDQHRTSDFKEWGVNARYDEQQIAKLVDPKSEAYDDIAFHYYLQYHLDKQLYQVAEYARQRGVILKGDLPIGIYRYSVDAWVEPALYNLDVQAGAPPDPFSENGQNWGLPTYDWDEMEADGFAWWRKRFQKSERYFDAFRVDHILGFFRIWEIPADQVQGLMGYFNKALPLTMADFNQHQIAFDYDRFCKPYLPQDWVAEKLGDDLAFAEEHFLEAGAQDGFYQFRAGKNTQRAILEFLESEAPDRMQLREPLFEMVANVLFLGAKGSDGKAFHPRISMDKTESYRRLPNELQHDLHHLYIDFFYRRHEEFWKEEGLRKLPALKSSTDMLICGEDLGMVPACVPEVMYELDILSLEIQRMSKNPQSQFLQHSDIPYFSVCSPSTHDMAPIRAWWEEMDVASKNRFYFEELGLGGTVPHFCEPYLARRIIEKHLNFPSMLAIFPIQDLLAMDPQLRRENPFEERINVPADPNHYWGYRLHLPIEDLLRADKFNAQLRDMLAHCHR